MAVINHAKKEINAKVVFFGPPSSGKSTIFRYIHQRIKPSLCGPLKSMPAGGSTMLFFDYIPFENILLDGYKVRFHLYTLTGPVDNHATWKMVLKGVDGLAMVVESGSEGTGESSESLLMLRSVLSGYGKSFDATPAVLISNKADIKSPVTGLPWLSDLPNLKHIVSSAVTGEGILNALATLSQSLMTSLQHEQNEADLNVADAETDEPLELLEEPEDVADAGNIEALLASAAIKAGAAPVSLRIPVVVGADGGERRLVLKIDLSVEEG